MLKDERQFDFNKYKKYKLFYEFCIKDKFIIKPNCYSSYATQGCCFVDDKIFITSYDTKYDSNLVRVCRNNSRLDIIYKDGNYKSLFFNNKSHVGGISFHNKLFITGNMCIKGYDLDYVLSLSNNNIINEDVTYEIDKKLLGSVSYLTTYDESIFVGEFNKYKSTNLIKYNTNNSLCVDCVYKVPFNKVQGLCICEYDDVEYYFFSCSYGRKMYSKLYVARIIDGKFHKLLEFKLPSMSEQISNDSF